MAKILVLGKTGMLGSMVYQYLKYASNNNVDGTGKKGKTEKADKLFDVVDFVNKNDNFSYLLNYDYIINCIGIIKPYCKDTDQIGKLNAILINALFPHMLSIYCKKSNVKIIQITTDCVFSGKCGNYNEDSIQDPEDVYGKTKSLGEVLNENVLNIRCSIIGPELKNKLGLLEWFLNQKDNARIQGFSNHKWNGVTTLQFAKLCLRIIENNKFLEFTQNSFLYHFVPNNAVSKYELLKLFQKVFKKNIIVNSAKSKNVINRTLTTKYPRFTNFYGHGTIQNALLELNNFMKTNYK